MGRRRGGRGGDVHMVVLWEVILTLVCFLNRTSAHSCLGYHRGRPTTDQKNHRCSNSTTDRGYIRLQPSRINPPFAEPCIAPMRAALFRWWLCRKRTGRSEFGVWCQRSGAFARRASPLERRKWAGVAGAGGRGAPRQASQLLRCGGHGCGTWLPEGYVPVQSRMCRRELTPRVPTPVLLDLLRGSAGRDTKASEIDTALPLRGLSGCQFLSHSRQNRWGVPVRPVRRRRRLRVPRGWLVGGLRLPGA